MISAPNRMQTFTTPIEPIDHGLAADILHECALTRNLNEGKRIHSLLTGSGQDDDAHLGNLLITMYGKCRLVREARTVFEKLSERNLRSWNVMISAYAQNGHLQEATKLFKLMCQEGELPDNFTFSSVLSAYTNLLEFSEGRKLHEHVVELGYLSDMFISTALVNFYGKCGSLRDAQGVFEAALSEGRNVGLWTAMIAAYIEHNKCHQALGLYLRMLLEGVKPNIQTYITVLNGCALLGASKQGKEVHYCIKTLGLDSNTVIGTSIVNMYGKCKCPGDARLVFDKLEKKDLITWNAMLAAYMHQSQGSEAFRLFKRMQLEGIKPDKFTLSTMVTALETLPQIQYIESIASQCCMLENDVFLANALVSTYGKNRCIDGARRVFNSMQIRDFISWTSVIGAYVENGLYQEALVLFHQMNQEGFKANEVTLVSALDACQSLGDLKQGRAVHAAIEGIRVDFILGTAIVNMYGRCGCLKSARDVFEAMQETDIVTWTSIIGSHAHHGNREVAMEMFQRMELEGLTPTAVTFIIFINACSHAGFVDEALMYFASMTNDYGILPEAQHCLCIIDLLARSGRLEDAEVFIERMPFKPDAVAWTTLLAACRVTGEMHRGDKAAKDLFASEGSPGDGGAYVMVESTLSGNT